MKHPNYSLDFTSLAGERPPYPPARLQAAKPHRRTRSPPLTRTLHSAGSPRPRPIPAQNISRSSGNHRTTWAGASNLRIAALCPHVLLQQWSTGVSLWIEGEECVWTVEKMPDGSSVEGERCRGGDEGFDYACYCFVEGVEVYGVLSPTSATHASFI